MTSASMPRGSKSRQRGSKGRRPPLGTHFSSCGHRCGNFPKTPSQSAWMLEVRRTPLPPSSAFDGIRVTRFRTPLSLSAQRTLPRHARKLGSTLKPDDFASFLHHVDLQPVRSRNVAQFHSGWTCAGVFGVDDQFDLVVGASYFGMISGVP